MQSLLLKTAKPCWSTHSSKGQHVCISHKYCMYVIYVNDMNVCHTITVNNTHVLNKKLKRVTDFLYIYCSRIITIWVKDFM